MKALIKLLTFAFVAVMLSSCTSVGITDAPAETNVNEVKSANTQSVTADTDWPSRGTVTPSK